MATYKQVTLKDPKTGDYLIPRVYGTLSYQLINGEITPPFDPQLDAYTLEGHPASYFATANHTHTQYAASSHNHEIANINGLQSELDEVKTSVSEGKALVAAAVTGKGVSTAADATFQQIATNIGSIQTGSTSGVLYIDDFTGYGATINVPWYSGQKRLRLLARSASQGWRDNTIIYTKTNYILNINSDLYHISDGGSEIPDTLSYIFSSISWLTDSVQLVLKPSKGLDVGSILFTY